MAETTIEYGSVPGGTKRGRRRKWAPVLREVIANCPRETDEAGNPIGGKVAVRDTGTAANSIAQTLRTTAKAEGLEGQVSVHARPEEEGVTDGPYGVWVVPTDGAQAEAAEQPAKKATTRKKSTRKKATTQASGRRRRTAKAS